jgi:hypothetical protein
MVVEIILTSVKAVLIVHPSVKNPRLSVADLSGHFVHCLANLPNACLH